MTTLPATRVESNPARSLSSATKWLVALLVGAAALLGNAERVEAATVRNFYVDLYANGKQYRWTYRNQIEAAQVVNYLRQTYPGCRVDFLYHDVEVSDFATRTPNPLGQRWVEEEGGQHSGVFIRRGNSNVFDASWSGGHRAVLTITVSGSTVNIRRVNLQGKLDGTYTGTLHGDGTVSGTYFGGKWSARIDP